MEISKVWLMTKDKGKIAVLVEVDGKWYEIINEFGPVEGEISFCAHVEERLPSNAVEVDFEKVTA